MENLLEKNHRPEQPGAAKELMDAFEKYYHEDILMQENELKPTIGKAANRQRELEFLSKVTDFRGARPLKVTAGQDCTMVEWHYDYTHSEGARRITPKSPYKNGKTGKSLKKSFTTLTNWKKCYVKFYLPIMTGRD